jgi:hypothetical protein
MMGEGVCMMGEGGCMMDVVCMLNHNLEADGRLIGG